MVRRLTGPIADMAAGIKNYKGYRSPALVVRNLDQCFPFGRIDDRTFHVDEYPRLVPMLPRRQLPRVSPACIAKRNARYCVPGTWVTPGDSPAPRIRVADLPLMRGSLPLRDCRGARSGCPDPSCMRNIASIDASGLLFISTLFPNLFPNVVIKIGK